MKIYFIILVLLLFGCSESSKEKLSYSKEECLDYEPAKVQLEGELYKKSFPGPPNYEDIKKGDEEEIYWLIKTTKAFCVNESSYVDGAELQDQSEVQLVIGSKLNFYKTKRYLLNKKIKVKGPLFPQITGHHKTAVLLTVETLENGDE